MIIDDGYYNHRADAQNQVAAFHVQLVENFWKQAPDVIMNLPEGDHFKINRALCDTFDEFLEIYMVNEEYEYDAVQHIPEPDMDGQTIHRMSQRIADELLNSDVVAVRKDRTLSGGRRYRCSIPFIKALQYQKGEES